MDFTGNVALQQTVVKEMGKRNKTNTDFAPSEKLVKSDGFDQFMGVMLILNALVMGIQVNWQAGHLEESDPTVFGWIDKIFCVIFVSELLLRMHVFRTDFYFMEDWKWSVFDTAIVGLQVMEEVMAIVNSVTGPGEGGEGGSNFGFLKLLKIGRLLRMVRMVRLIPELKSMVYLILASMGSFLWTCVLLALLIYVIAVYMTMMATDSLKSSLSSGSENTPQRDELKIYWGSVGDSIMSLFHSISGGADWADIIGPLTVETGTQVHNVTFTMFIAFATMVIMNLVTGVFVEGASRLAKEDKDKELVKMAFKIFDIVDDDGSAEITYDELMDNMASNSLVEYLAAMDLSSTNAADLFKLLDEDESGTINIEEFVYGCMRLKGGARAADVCQIVVDMRGVISSLKKLCEDNEKSDSKFGQIWQEMRLLSARTIRIEECVRTAVQDSMMPCVESDLV